ncbi:FGGY-family carbohydrate kinase [Corynebacterium sp. LK2510]|uniref:FGGY-family carbohydrate kinase n=1 Tax=Corynebacterium sp. LK2510 TaxID=3110472 RepID=UPI0034CDA4AF
MSIRPEAGRGPFVLALDVGSGASRGALYDATGCPLKGSKQRIAHQFTVTADGASTIHADQVVDECREIIDGIVEYAAHHGIPVDAVAMDSFASSFILVDADGRALTPCATYADARSRDYVAELVRRGVDEAAYHQRTGVRLHTSYHPARLLWAQTLPEWDRAAKVLTLGEYVYLQLAGIEGMATSMAAWSGICDAHTGRLDHAILEATGTPASMFQPLCGPDEPATPASTEWDALDAIPWFHCVPDGWASNIGAGGTDESTVAVAAATSGAARVIVREVPATIPHGLWCYRLGRNQAILGGALNDVGRALEWAERVLVGVDKHELAEVLRTPPAAAPFVLPFFSGERATGWASGATASFAQVTAATGPLEMWRGIVDGIALSYERVLDQLAQAGARPERVVASGGVVAAYPEWLHVLADATSIAVVPLVMKRTTLRGTALIALEQLQPGGERAVAPFGEAVEPNSANSAYFDALRAEFTRYYEALVAQVKN